MRCSRSRCHSTLHRLFSTTSRRVCTLLFACASLATVRGASTQVLPVAAWILAQVTASQHCSPLLLFCHVTPVPELPRDADAPTMLGTATFITRSFVSHVPFAIRVAAAHLSVAELHIAARACFERVIMESGEASLLPIADPCRMHVPANSPRSSPCFSFTLSLQRPLCCQRAANTLSDA